MDDIAETAMMFVNQAAKYSDRAVFDYTGDELAFLEVGSAPD